MKKKETDDTSNHLSIGGGLSGERIEEKSNTGNQKQIIKQEPLNNQKNGSGNISNSRTY